MFLCRQNRWKDAEPYFERAVENPVYTQPEVALANAGVCALNAGDRVKAEESFRAALTKNPTFADALSNLVDMSYQDKDYLQARAFLQRYMAVRPPTAPAALDLLQHRAAARKSRGGESLRRATARGIPRVAGVQRNYRSCSRAMADSEQRAGSAAGTPLAARSVGTMLAQARLARDLSLEQVSTELRIEPQQLDALEQDRFERIGVPVFVKGYIRQYGAFLGVDVPDLLAQYYKQSSLKEVQVQPSKTIKLHDERQITVWIVAALILAALVVALGLWWSNGGRLPGSVTAPATQTSTEPAAPAGAAGPVTAPVPAAAPATLAAPTPTPPATGAAPAGASAGAAPGPSPAAAAATGVAAPASAPPGAAASAAAPASSPAAGEAPAANDVRAPAFLATLDVVFEQESWAEISDARGQRLFYAMGRAGRTAKLSGEPPFAVVLGNSVGVKIALDGEDFPVPTSGRPGDYARFGVDVVEE